MRGLGWVSLALLGLFASGCELESLDDGGGGGGVGNFPFSEGFVFIRTGDRNVYAANAADLSTVGQLTANGGNAQPSISRDGRRVVFVHSEGASTEIQLVASSGGTPTPVLASDGTRSRLRNPVFTPDGTRIVFTYDSGGASLIGVVNDDGSGFRKVAGGSTLSYASPTFYPDGQSLLVAAGSSAGLLTQLERVNLETGAPQNVASTFGNEAQTVANRVVISPDGTQAAFDGTTASGATRIFVIALTGAKAVRQLTEYPGEPNANDRFPTWQDGGKVAFESDTGGSDQVYALSATVQKSSGGLTLPAATEPWFGP